MQMFPNLTSGHSKIIKKNHWLQLSLKMNTDLVEIIFPYVGIATRGQNPFSIESNVSDSITIRSSELNSHCSEFIFSRHHNTVPVLPSYCKQVARQGCYAENWTRRFVYYFDYCTVLYAEKYKLKMINSYSIYRNSFNRRGISYTLSPHLVHFHRLCDTQITSNTGVTYRCVLFYEIKINRSTFGSKFENGLTNIAISA